MRGFTLIELLVVMALLALVVALVPPSFERMRESMQYRDTLRRVLADLRSARQLALAQGRDARFSIDLPARQFGVDGRPTSSLPETLQVRFTSAQVELSAQQKVSIRFHPQGGATGGSVELVRPSGAGTRITVDWLSGAITQSALGS
ncbi:MAG: GspH/FimT family pseudopilin [Ramlibacter sp.]|nr:GspH/FimT family pseudopilin [Ramlibacter sp.]